MDCFIKDVQYHVDNTKKFFKLVRGSYNDLWDMKHAMDKKMITTINGVYTVTCT